MSKTLETRVEALEAQTGGDERELFEIIWGRDREPEPGTLVISWLSEWEREVSNEPGDTS